MKIKADCPYCNFENTYIFTEVELIESNYRQTVWCELEEGGCDKLFFIDIFNIITARSYKIDGYNK